MQTPSKPPALPKPKALTRVPHPANNLGAHLKAPKSGEIVTTKRWSDRKAAK